jgi:hypothetical protein
MGRLEHRLRAGSEGQHRAPAAGRDRRRQWLPVFLPTLEAADGVRISHGLERLLRC